MPEIKSLYTTRVRGRWNARHEVGGEDGPVGVLTTKRNPFGLVVSGEFRPEKGEVLAFRRDPGLLRAQFSLWTDGREWLGSSLRWSFLHREIRLETGGKPFRLLPVEGFRRGWVLLAPRTGETARMTTGLVGRDARLEVYRRLDLPLLLFAYFLGSLAWNETLWPGPVLEEHKEAWN